MSDEHLGEMRTHLTDERQDEPGYVTWNKPSQLVALTDVEVQRLYRKMATENKHNFDRQVELELMGRFTVALKQFATHPTRLRAGSYSSRGFSWC